MPATSPVNDPAADAAALLRRLGMAALAIGLPLAGLLARRGVIVALPIAIALLAVASALDRRDRATRIGWDRLAASPAVAAIAAGLAWAALSLAWTVAPGASSERLTALAGMLVLALAGFLALPERVRAANLYLVPIGTALAAGLALALTTVPAFRPLDLDEDGASLGRGIAVATLFAWPSVAWLRSRGRDVEAVCLAILVAAAAAAGPGVAPLLAFALGAVVYAAASLRPGGTITVAAALVALATLAAPLLPLAGAALADRVAPDSGASALFHDWARVAFGEPRRLLTGYGLGSLVFARLAGFLPPATPDTPLLQVWYEFGLVGALSAALALWFGTRGIRAAVATLQPGLAAAIVTAFALATLGVGSGQAWWPSALAAVALVFVSVERGQFRTRLPRAGRLAVLPEPSAG